MTVAGNTVMHHLFLEIPPRFLASSPYTPAVSGSLAVETYKLSIDVNPGGKVYTLPLIAGFIGSDFVVGLATGIDQSEETSPPFLYVSRISI